MKGIRAVKSRLVPDRNGMPVVEIDHDSLARAAWELTMKKFFPEPDPPTTWQKFVTWVKSLCKHPTQ